MKAQELRIGNYLIDEYMKIFQVKQIGTGLIESCGMYIYENEEIKPIELTEEILLKCGGILHGSEYIIKTRALPIKIRFNSGIAYCEFGNVYLGDSIKHLHQLQNLYFALCNQELNIQL